MQVNRALEQQIAVFGESGSGKTVLLSSFYGATQEPQYSKKSLFNVVAEDLGQGARLHRNYLGMRNSGRLPMPNHFRATSYAFKVKLKQSDAGARRRPFDALRVIWHDYPGEWFEQGVSGPEEAQRRVDGFRSLLGSDVALLLVDGQRLLDNVGHEERYLKSLLTNFRNGLLLLKDDLLEDGKPLVEFPRIWVMALSKADLLPDMDVFAFRDLLTEKADEDLNELRSVLAGLVESGNALSVGEDFVLLSSAKFEHGEIEVSKRVGVELVLPMAATLPFERHVKWSETEQVSRKVAENLLDGAGAMATVLLGVMSRLPGPIGAIVALVGGSAVHEASKLVGEKLRESNARALAKGDHLMAILTRFRMDLEEGEQNDVLLKSPR